MAGFTHPLVNIMNPFHFCQTSFQKVPRIFLGEILHIMFFETFKNSIKKILNSIRKSETINYRASLFSAHWNNSDRASMRTHGTTYSATTLIDDTGSTYLKICFANKKTESTCFSPKGWSVNKMARNTWKFVLVLRPRFQNFCYSKNI